MSSLGGPTFRKKILPVLGTLTRYMTPTLDVALARGRTTSSSVGADLGQTSDSRV